MLSAGEALMPAAVLRKPAIGLAETGISSPLTSYGGAILAAILLLALAVRTAALFSLKESVYFDFLLWDERLYHEWATQLAKGTFRSTSVYEFAPLPAYFLALLYKLFSPDPAWFRIANIFFGVATCYFVYRLGQALAGSKAGLLAAFVAALYKPFVLYSIVPLKTSLSLFLFSLTLCLFLSVLDDEDPGGKAAVRVALLGVCMGLCGNVRANTFILAPFFPVVLFAVFSRRQSPGLKKTMALVLLYGVGLVAAVSPFVIRNYHVAGEIALTTSQTGRNLYYGNSLENEFPYYRPAAFASSVPGEQAVQFVIEAARRTGRHMSPQAASAYWTREVLRIAAEHPATFAGKLFQKMLAFLNRFEAGDHYHAGFIGDPVPFFRLPFFSFWLVFPLGMAGMLLRLGDCTNSRALFMVFMLYGLTLVAFVVGARYRLPALTILIPFAAAGLIRCAGLLRNRQHRKMGVYGLLVLAFGLVEVLPVRGAGDLTPYYNTHAVVLDAAGRTKEAIGYWEASSDMNGSFSPVSRLYLAGKYYPMGRRTEALRLIERIPADSFAAAAKYSLLGDLMRHEKKFTEAAAAYEKSLEINSGQSRIRRALIAIYRRSGKGKVFEEYRKLQEIRAYFDGKKPLQP